MPRLYSPVALSQPQSPVRLAPSPLEKEPLSAAADPQPVDDAPRLADQFGRRKRKLRLSITDRCNFRCSYCMPDDPDYLPADSRLKRAEFVSLARLFVEDFGITHLRITGGEPTLHPELLPLVQDLNALRASGMEHIHLSTNASRLKTLAVDLKSAGLDGVNVSIDTLDPARFAEMCGSGARLNDALDGIEAARVAGLPIKLNMVVQAGRNDDEIVPMLEFAGSIGAELRYIEFMPLDGGHGWSKGEVVSHDSILSRIGPVEALSRDEAPARRYRQASGQTFGIIASVTQPFCGSCDRLRLTSDGQLVNCLYSGHGLPLRPWIQQPDELRERIQAHVYNKPRGYIDGVKETPMRMYRLGG